MKNRQAENGKENISVVWEVDLGVVVNAVKWKFVVYTSLGSECLTC